tara:strand:- start:1106 stop:2209 length:1104 start_codon:yes stop_codon:yes gene_type:complete
MVAQKNLLLYLGTHGFGEQDGDGILLEDDKTGTIILNGTEPLPALTFILDETDGDNFILESGTIGVDTDRILSESSIVTFRPDQRANVADKLLQDNPTNIDDLPLSEYDNLRFVDILRSSKILTEQPSFLLDEKQLLNKIIAERDNVTPLRTEDDAFLVLEDFITADELYVNRHLLSGQGDIDSGFVDEDGIALEISGFLLLDATDESPPGAIELTIGNQGSRIISEDNFSFFLEENGVFLIEDFSPESMKHAILTEDATIGNFLRLERSLQPEPADAVQVEIGTTDLTTDNILYEDGFKILYEEDFSDINATLEHILLEESTFEFDKGQIPHENFALSFDQDRPARAVTQGMQPITIPATIRTTIS